MKSTASFDPRRDIYLMKDPRLESAIEVALDLGMPLMVTGEPGTGKTRLAYYIAQQILGVDQPLIFNTKTSAKAKDLFYKYNALTHFRDAQSGKADINPMDYVSFEPLGKAILESANKRNVVLIDEIDKAPRDFPNDVLFEFEELAFRVEEASKEEVKQWAERQSAGGSGQYAGVKVDEQGFIRFAGKTSERPVLLITSNTEKNLPEPFLRRCVYYHIPFPDKSVLQEIVQAKVPLEAAFVARMLPAALEYFREIREKKLRKSPATAELIAWIHLLNKKNIDVALNRARGADEKLKEELLRTFTVLLKNKEDRRRMEDELKRL
jgi:MoxR-like ATPase